MPGISRAQVTMKAGQRVLQLATAAKLLPGAFSLARTSICDDLRRVVESCREARGMYLNYPRLRDHLLSMADTVQGLIDDLERLDAEAVDNDRTRIAYIGLALRRLDFSPPSAGQAQSTLSIATPYDPAAALRAAMEDPNDKL